MQDVQIAFPLCGLVHGPPSEDSAETAVHAADSQDDSSSLNSEAKFADLFLARLKQSNEVHIRLDPVA